MKELAIIAVALILSLVIASQHLFNWWCRKDFQKTPLVIIGVFGIIISIAIAIITVYNAIIILGPLTNNS